MLRWCSRTRSLCVMLCLLCLVSLPSLAGEPWHGPERVSVWPVFFVPQGETEPTAAQISRLEKHLGWAQRRFRAMLAGRDSFTIADRPALVFPGRHDLATYRSAPKVSANRFVGELLGALRLNRLNLSWSHIVGQLGSAVKGRCPYLC